MKREASAEFGVLLFGVRQPRVGNRKLALACAVNRSLLLGVGGLVVLNVASRVLGVHLDHSLQIWLRNIAFFGPAIFLLIALSNIRLDTLPLWVGTAFRSVGNRWVEGPALAAVGIFGAFLGRRR